MKGIISPIVLFLIVTGTGCGGMFTPNTDGPPDFPAASTADHSITRSLYDGQIPPAAIQQAVDTLHIGYGHTSHGSQITDGMSGLVAFANNNGNWSQYGTDLFAWSHDGSAGLHLFDGYTSGTSYLEDDCGVSGWDEETREYLDSHPSCNVIMWSWCGQVNEVNLTTHYLEPMAALETEYPDVTFIYMTGHLEGGPDDPALNSVLASNNVIRDYCEANGKWLYDFADIEKYNLDGEYFGDKLATDGCAYDSDGDNYRDGNWAQEWQNSHTENTDWYSCGAAHSLPVNANQKAYAAWWLFARLAGWEG
ncbi:MAG: hypothetical protein JXA95_10130 [Spirochaetales bacterium]|nr:hypothetical protein [Spirochaetales bacterium]